MRGKAGHGRLGADFPFTPKASHMYGSIHFRADIAQMVFTLPYHSHLSTTMEVTQKNLATANEGCRLALEWMGETGSRDFTLYQDVCALHTCLPPAIKEFAMRSLAIHRRLSPDQQAQRIQRFAQVWDNCSLIPTQQPEWRQQKAIAMVVAKTYPTELIEAWTRVVCRWLAPMAADTLHPVTDLPVVPAFAAIHQRRDLGKLSQAQRTTLSDLLVTRSPLDREETVQRLAALPMNSLSRQLDAMAASRQHPAWAQLGDYLMKVHLPDAWAKAVITAARGDQGAFDDALALHVGQSVDAFLSLVERMLRDTLDAVRAGIRLGDRWDTASRQALEAWEEHGKRQSKTWTIELRRSLRGSPPASPAEPPSANREALQSWGIDQLVRWIDGPVTAPRTGAAVTKVQQQPQPEPAPIEDTAGAKDSRTNASDMPRLLPMALSDSARFLLGEWQDLSALADHLGQRALIDPWLNSTTPDLQALAEQRTDTQRDLAAEHELLTRVDQSLAQLRTGLQAIKAQAQLSARFGTALAQALRTENLMLGKRQGGVIACPLPATHWGLVHERYHQRLLPMRHTVGMGNGTLTLATDQALALYVTGSSQSGYAFDISVHLWARRTGKSSQPSREQGAYPRMNTDDWFDTYQPCCVLHVPLAR